MTYNIYQITNIVLAVAGLLPFFSFFFDFPFANSRLSVWFIKPNKFPSYRPGVFILLKDVAFRRVFTLWLSERSNASP